MSKEKTPAQAGKKGRGRGLLLGLGCAAAVLVLLGAVLYATGIVSRTVGATVKQKDVTEFYYTLSASTNPPRFQRYRFYTAEGKYYFYHEKREGDHWPLREEDVTVSGTKELTEGEWDAFFDTLRGGSVRRRRESADAGGRGPWLYLYWRGDHGKIQEFTFASPELKRTFEDLCLRLME